MIGETGMAAGASIASGQDPMDIIHMLRVSGKWKRRLVLIARAGGPGLPRADALSREERSSLVFNIPAIIFGSLYLLVEGMWRQAITLYVSAFVSEVFLSALGFSWSWLPVTVATSVVASRTAAKTFYRKHVLQDRTWRLDL